MIHYTFCYCNNIAKYKDIVFPFIYRTSNAYLISLYLRLAFKAS